MHSGGGGSVDPCRNMMVSSRFTLLQRFRPITIERPKVLLPLVNVPMLEYTLEWLAMNKVEEVHAWGLGAAWQPLPAVHDTGTMLLTGLRHSREAGRQGETLRGISALGPPARGANPCCPAHRHTHAH